MHEISGVPRAQNLAMINKPAAKRMLVFHSAYTFEDIKARSLEVYVTSKDAGKFFETILTVSPIASLQYAAEHPLLFGKPDFYELDSRNAILEGKTSLP